jgi:hypothetical protein
MKSTDPAEWLGRKRETVCRPTIGFVTIYRGGEPVRVYAMKGFPCPGPDTGTRKEGVDGLSGGWTPFRRSGIRDAEFGWWINLRCWNRPRSAYAAINGGRIAVALALRDVQRLCGRATPSGSSGNVSGVSGAFAVHSWMWICGVMYGRFEIRSRDRRL